VYYFDGWSGKMERTGPGRSWENSLWAKSWHELEAAGHVIDSWENEPWAKIAPTHLTRRLAEEFSGREPVWGWRNDTQEIMERQIDVAADNGIDFFTFCWYWRDRGGSINPAVVENLPVNTSLQLYMTARNKNKLKYALLIVNNPRNSTVINSGSVIQGNDNWKDGVKYWAKYFKDPQYVTVDGKPLVIIFGPDGITEEELAVMQETAIKEGFKKGLAIAGRGQGAKNKQGFTHCTHYNITPRCAGSEERKFEEIVNASKAQWEGTEEQPYIPVLTAGWDNRPWEGPDGLGQKEGCYFPDNSPEKFKNFLTDAIHWMDENPTKTTQERLVLIFAWNEFGEGGYLAPTKDDPDAAKLKVIKEMVKGK